MKCKKMTDGMSSLKNSQLAGIDMDPNDVTDRINTEFGEIKEIMGM